MDWATYILGIQTGLILGAVAVLIAHYVKPAKGGA